MRMLAIAVVLLVMAAPAARADVTVFLGADMTPSSRPVTGFAVGAGLVIVAFEIEYATAGDNVSALAPSLKTGMGNVLLQTPFEIFRFQPYATAGAGIYQEELGTHQDTSVGTNVGGGVKMTLVGPLRLRVDYRVFKLGSGALNSPAQRVYAGLNLKF